MVPQDIHSIQKIISFIEDNYKEEINVQKIEALSNYSYRNVQRIFKNIFEETLKEFQLRLKLENAYKSLIYSNDPITVVALNSGYANGQSFSKAFKLFFKITPQEARNTKQALIPCYKNLELLQAENLYVNSKTVFFKGIKTNYDNDEINDLWDSIGPTPANSEPTFYGLIIDQALISSKSKCRFEAAIHLEKDSLELPSKQIFGGRYLRYTHNGSYSTIEDTYKMMFQDCLYHRKKELKNTPIIEFYIKNDMNCALEKDYVTHIFVPLK